MHCLTLVRMLFHSHGPITLNDLFANDSPFTLGISSFMYTFAACRMTKFVTGCLYLKSIDLCFQGILIDTHKILKPCSLCINPEYIGWLILRCLDLCALEKDLT